MFIADNGSVLPLTFCSTYMKCVFNRCDLKGKPSKKAAFFLYVLFNTYITVAFDGYVSGIKRFRGYFTIGFFSIM